MEPYLELIKTAKRLGHEITPQLKSDLRKLACVSDEDIMGELRKAKIKQIAEDFGVPYAVAEKRLEGSL